MSERPKATTSASDGSESEVRDELRTISFRLREIQRLLAARVAQENRRLESDGLEPVEAKRFTADPDADR